MPPLKLVVFVGSCRTGRLAERLKRHVTSQLEKRGHQVSVIDPEEEPNLLAVRKPLHFYGPDEAPPAWLGQLHETVKAAHGYLVLCPEYNRCIAPALGSAMDHFPPDSYRHKPCAIVAYTIGEAAPTVETQQANFGIFRRRRGDSSLSWMTTLVCRSRPGRCHAASQLPGRAGHGNGAVREPQRQSPDAGRRRRQRLGRRLLRALGQAHRRARVVRGGAQEPQGGLRPAGVVFQAAPERSETTFHFVRERKILGIIKMVTIFN
ncbi:uncharacterized protein [Dermacentor albipictus]